MKLKIKFTFTGISIVFLLFFTQIHFAAEVQLIQASGEVKVRRGVEEKWESAQINILLEDIDTIWTGEDGKAVLRTKDGNEFQLRPNSMLDIADLRKIDEQELFLTLTKMKVNKLDKKDQKNPLRLGTVSVVHGSSQDSMEISPASGTPDWQEPNMNGIRDLFSQAYYPNAILKIEKFYGLYSTVEDCGELHYYLGFAFETLGQIGQAHNAYQQVMQQVENSCPQAKWPQMAKQGLERIKQTHQK